MGIQSISLILKNLKVINMDNQFTPYMGTKIVKAKFMTLGDYNVYRGWVIPKDEDPKTKGYLVEYVDGGKPNHANHAGYISWSSKDVFDKAYKALDYEPSVLTDMEQGEFVFISDGLTARNISKKRTDVYSYVVNTSKPPYNVVATLAFQNNNPNEHGWSGLTNDVLLGVVLHRLEVQNFKFPCTENELAIEKLRVIIDALLKRTVDRKQRNVSGKQEV